MTAAVTTTTELPDITTRPFLHHATTSPTAPDFAHTHHSRSDSMIPSQLPTPVSAMMEAGPSQPRAIPPPPNPRRHRSGVLMSRVRANSSGIGKAGIVGSSKSWGDLSQNGLGMSTMADGDDAREGEERHRENGRDWKRVVSEGMARRPSEDNEDQIWDNSARFYHHLHSRPPSRTASRSTSPNRSPVSQTPTEGLNASPIYVRRSLTLPNDCIMPTNVSASLSPNHIFLQQHLPPTFPHLGHSPEASSELLGPTPSMVILTPTTQEWRELKELSCEEGDELESSSGTGTSDDGRRSSVDSEAQVDSGSSSILLHNPVPMRPVIRQTLSVDILSKETQHTLDPGSPILTSADLESPNRPIFKPVIIAPSPVMPGDDQVPVPQDTPTKGGINEDDAMSDSDEAVVHEDSPVRFASIGRRESLRAIKKPEAARPGIPRVKTKRELEREKLFKDLDELLEENGTGESGWDGGVTQIGQGGGLTSRPSSADAVLDVPNNLFDDTFAKLTAPPRGTSVPISSKPQLSPSQPMRPSPLHASPLNAASGLPTPEDSPGLVSPPAGTPPLTGITPRSPSPFSAQATNLDSIRNFARGLIGPHSSNARSRTNTSTPSPPPAPSSPRTRRRDTKRVSLVAGRVVQPFTIPPNTSLPPIQTTPPNNLSPRKDKSNLSSFSPFRSPNLGASRGLIAPPSLNRFDSTISLAPSVDAPSDPGTPDSETAGGLGGRGIDDYVILSEAGKGAYGLVMRAKVKGPKGEPTGVSDRQLEEIMADSEKDVVIIKYIIKARILADCWKKHKSLGPIPVELHVLDQLRHLTYNRPLKPLPWDPRRSQEPVDIEANAPDTPDSARSSPRSDSSAMLFSPTQRYIASEIRHSPERGHPNICKLLDFFEDREFYYLVMPHFGTGVDLFDRVESQPSGLDPFEVRSIFGQLADAVRFLHSNGIVHRDIKDENVILDGSGQCQLIDFGSAAHWRAGKKWDTFSGTLHYASPEILRGDMYGGKEQDVWALGVVAYVLLVGETPFSELPDEVLAGLSGESGAEVALAARCGGGDVNEGGEGDGGGRLEDAADLVRRCLEMELTARPSAEMICQHRYLRGEGGWTGKKGWIGFGFR